MGLDLKAKLNGYTSKETTFGGRSLKMRAKDSDKTNIN